MSGSKAEYIATVMQAAQAVDGAEIDRCLEALHAAYREGRGVFVIGNGGSASNASHLAQDLSKGTLEDLEGRRFRVMSLTDNVSMLTALSNDIGYERVFDLQLRQFARAGDLLIAISGSGNSPNILRAVEYARQAGMTVVGVTGYEGGKLRALSHIRLHVAVNHMGMAEAVHGVLFHLIVDSLRARFGTGPGKC